MFLAVKFLTVLRKARPQSPITLGRLSGKRESGGKDKRENTIAGGGCGGRRRDDWRESVREREDYIL